MIIALLMKWRYWRSELFSFVHQIFTISKGNAVDLNAMFCKNVCSVSHF